MPGRTKGGLIILKKKKIRIWELQGTGFLPSSVDRVAVPGTMQSLGLPQLKTDLSV